MKRTLAAVGLAVVALIVTSGLTLGAISGSVVPSIGHPGDWIELTTDAGDRPGTYSKHRVRRPNVDLPRGCRPDKRGERLWLAGGSYDMVRWDRDAQVPSACRRTRRLLVPREHPGSCWRFGSGHGILTFSVLPGNAGVPFAALAAAAGVALGALAIVVFLARGRVNASRDIRER
jgi:hypothetical protein